MTEPATDLAMTFDATAPRALAEFWRRALGYEESPPPEGWDTWEAWLTDHDVPEEEWDDGASIRDPAGHHPSITFLKVPEPRTAKNRLHLDLKVSGGRHVEAALRTERIEEKVAQLLAAGGTVQERFTVRDRLDHVVMEDPEGNVFCVV